MWMSSQTISLLTSRVPLSSGVTGEGLVVPGATPGTGVGGVPDGSAVLVPGGTGVPGKPGSSIHNVFTLILASVTLALWLTAEPKDSIS